MQNYRNVVLYLGFPQKMPTRSPSPSSCVLGKKDVSRVASPMLPGLVVHTRDPVLGRLTQRMSLRIIWALHCVSGEVKKTPSCLLELLSLLLISGFPELLGLWLFWGSGTQEGPAGKVCPYPSYRETCILLPYKSAFCRLTPREVGAS